VRPPHRPARLGKTTFYRHYFSATHRHISKDLWPNARSKSRRQDRELNEAFAGARSVVVDNTHPSAVERAPVIAAARAAGARVVGYYFDVPTRQAVARNAAREGRSRVPNVAIFAAAKRLQRPEFGEGFDQLFRVSFTPDGRLSVEEITASSSWPA
jgi:predicted kinase